MQPMQPGVLDLAEVGPHDGARTGGKALRLAAMLRAGLPVPEGFCVTADALHGRVGDDGVLPRDLEEEIAAAYGRLGDAMPVAVRSSATTEDGAAASFAGQFDTFLHVVGREAVIDRVRACYQSLHNERAREYRARAGIADHGRMAVVVQRLVPAECAGVLFTLDPQSGHEMHMVVESVWGLGETLVSGRATPDRFVVNGAARTVVSRALADKRVMMRLAAPAGVEDAAVPEARRALSSLTDAQLWELVELGQRAQEHFGAPQDLEWAHHAGRTYLLQARPLTAIAFRDETTQWTSANFREVWPRFMSPLSLSLSGGRFGAEMQAFFVRLGMLPRDRAVEWCRSFFGQGYWNLGALKDVMQSLPGFVERVFDETVGLPIRYEGRGRVTPFTPATVVRGLPILMRVHRSYRTVWREAEAEGPRFLEDEAALDAIAPASLGDGPLFEVVQRAVAFRDRTDGFAIRTSLMSAQAQDELRPMVDRLNRGLSDDERVSLGKLLTGLARVGTAVPIFELWTLASQALDDPAIARVVAGSEAREIPERLRATPGAEGFCAKLDAFLRRSRHVTQYNDELELPRWDEEPTFALSTLREFVAAGERCDAVAVERRQAEEREREEARALRLLARGVPHRWIPYGVVRRLPAGLRWLDPRTRFIDQLGLVRKYAWWREETRHRLDRAIYQCRRFVLELGIRWARASTLAHAADVFHLPWSDVLALHEGRLTADDARRQIARYQSLRVAYRHFEPPGILGTGDGAAQRLLPARPGIEKPGPGRLLGVACSAGAREGAARIVRTLDEARHFRRGEVLVTQYTNPGWTPLFSLASAIVMEEGGLLSHGAVVARECGIPAVLQVRDATRRLTDGQRLRVDGTGGFVDVLD